MGGFSIYSPPEADLRYSVSCILYLIWSWMSSELLPKENPRLPQTPGLTRREPPMKRSKSSNKISFASKYLIRGHPNLRCQVNHAGDEFFLNRLFPFGKVF